MREYYWAWLCQQDESQSDRKATNKETLLFIRLWMTADIDYIIPYNEWQWSFNDFESCVLGDQTTDRLQTVTKEFLAAIIGKTDCDTLPAPS